MPSQLVGAVQQSVELSPQNIQYRTAPSSVHARKRHQLARMPATDIWEVYRTDRAVRARRQLALWAVDGSLAHACVHVHCIRHKTSAPASATASSYVKKQGGMGRARLRSRRARPGSERACDLVGLGMPATRRPGRPHLQLCYRSCAAGIFRPMLQHEKQNGCQTQKKELLHLNSVKTGCVQSCIWCNVYSPIQFVIVSKTRDTFQYSYSTVLTNKQHTN